VIVCILHLACALTLSQTTADWTPTEIPCEVAFAQCDINLQIAGKEYKFLIDTGNDKSYISSEMRKEIAASEKPPFLKLGNLLAPVLQFEDLSKFSLHVVSGVDGVLGMDMLAKLAFGIDYQNKKFFVWPAGHVMTSNAIEWLGSHTTTFIVVPMATMPNDDRFYVRSQYGYLTLDTAAPLSLLPSAPDQQKTFLTTGIHHKIDVFNMTLPDTEVKVAGLLQADGLSLENYPVLICKDLQGIGAVSGAMFGPRILIDGPAQTITVAPQRTPDEEFTMTLQVLTMGDAYLENGKVYVPVDTDDVPKKLVPEDKRWQIIAINKVKLDDLRAMYNNHDPKTGQVVRDIIKALDKGCDIDALAGDKRITVSLQFQLGS